MGGTFFLLPLCHPTIIHRGKVTAPEARKVVFCARFRFFAKFNYVFITIFAPISAAAMI